MSSKGIIASLIGGVVNFLLGYVIYDILLGGFYASHIGGTGVMREMPEMWAIALGCLVYAAMLGLIFDRWAGIKTVATGAKAGAWIGLLSGVAFAAWRYGGSLVFDGPIMILMEGLTMAVLSAVTGAVIGWWLGRGE